MESGSSAIQPTLISIAPLRTELSYTTTLINSLELSEAPSDVGKACPFRLIAPSHALSKRVTWMTMRLEKTSMVAWPFQLGVRCGNDMPCSRSAVI